jgi:ABC-type polysaccharide/polyol phosphate transport system ATPase subunit
MEGIVFCVRAQERFLVSVSHSAAKFQSGCKTIMAFDFAEMRTLRSLEERFELLMLASLQ